jgi:hypothetical protein
LAVTGGINWTEIAGAFGVGAVAAAVVTTYGGKGRERRKMRSRALARLEKIEITRLTSPMIDGSYYDMATFARLTSTCMIAGVPRPVVTLYSEICEVGRRFSAVTDSGDPSTWEVHPRAVMASISLADDAAQLLRDTLWRPALTFPFRWWRTWRLRKKALRLYEDYWPSTLPPNIYRDWIKERDARRKAERPARRWRLPGARHRVIDSAAQPAIETGGPQAEGPGQGR